MCFRAYEADLTRTCSFHFVSQCLIFILGRLFLQNLTSVTNFQYSICAVKSIISVKII